MLRMDCFFLEYLSEFSRGDKSFVKIAILGDGRAFEYANDNLKADKRFLLKMLHRTRDIRFMAYVTYELLDNREFMAKAVKINPQVLQYASDTLKADAKILIEVAKRDGLALLHGDKFARSRKEIIKLAVEENPHAHIFREEE